MSTLLVKNADLIVTMDGQDRELKDAAIFCRDGFIEQIGSQADLPQEADEVLDLSHHVVLPGLINTHHHFYQTLTRALPAAQDANLFNDTTLYPIWARMTPDDIFTSTKPPWRNWRFPDARPRQITSTFSLMAANWMTRFPLPRSECVCTPHAAQ